jgi:hypothetical protein
MHTYQDYTINSFLSSLFHLLPLENDTDPFLHAVTDAAADAMAEEATSETDEACSEADEATETAWVVTLPVILLITLEAVSEGLDTSEVIVPFPDPVSPCTAPRVTFIAPNGKARP